MIKIRYEDLTPPEKEYYKEFKKFFKGEYLGAWRLDEYTYIRFSSPCFREIYICLKSDKLHSFGRNDEDGHTVAKCSV